MKKLAILLTLCLAMLAVTTVPLLAAGPTGQAGKSNIGHLYLYEKNPADWSIVEGGAWGKMKYNLSCSTFDFVFNGHGLDSGVNYTLIYYPDKTGNPWPRTDIVCLASGTANGGGEIHLASSVPLGYDLPNPKVDINTGAKIWLVLSSDIDCSAKTMFGWNPTEYLFEYDLITYHYCGNGNGVR